MTIPPSSTQLYCQNCGAGWDKTNNTAQHHFKPRLTSAHLTSPQDIFLRIGEFGMQHCPKCPLPRVDEAMKEGDRTGDKNQR